MMLFEETLDSIIRSARAFGKTRPFTRENDLSSATPRFVGSRSREDPKKRFFIQ
jgi:hypothetical protein